LKKVPLGITAGEFPSNEIYIRATVACIPTLTLTADSTGVKAYVRFRFSAKHVKQLILRTAVDSIPSDATVRVGLYNVTTGSWISYRDYSGAAGENEDTITTLPSDGDILELRAEVTAASTTSGATFTLGYAALMVDYGVS